VSEPLITCTDLKKSFRLGELETPVLRGVTLSIPKNCFASIVGPSGCGKTTFLSLLGALDRADSGSLVVDGFDLVTADPKGQTEYRQNKIGFVFQFYNLLPSLTALENVETALEFLPLDPVERKKRALEYLAYVDLAKVAEKFPAQLSGGMQQRVAVARALARQPKLLLADEPTGNLDQESGTKVFECIRHLQSTLGVTCVMVTHDQELAGRTDQITRMADGHVV
jgi:putative ABC transport system ATP-binding protein